MTLINKIKKSVRKSNSIIDLGLPKYPSIKHSDNYFTHTWAGNPGTKHTEYCKTCNTFHLYAESISCHEVIMSYVLG